MAKNNLSEGGESVFFSSSNYSFFKCFWDMITKTAQHIKRCFVRLKQCLFNNGHKVVPLISQKIENCHSKSSLSVNTTESCAQDLISVSDIYSLQNERRQNQTNREIERAFMSQLDLDTFLEALADKFINHFMSKKSYKIPRILKTGSLPDPVMFKVNAAELNNNVQISPKLLQAVFSVSKARFFEELCSETTFFSENVRDIFFPFCQMRHSDSIKVSVSRAQLRLFARDLVIMMYEHMMDLKIKKTYKIPDGRASSDTSVHRINCIKKKTETTFSKFSPFHFFYNGRQNSQ